MIIYHGSYIEVPYPDITHSRPEVDFGRGFYTTPIRSQAADWCNKFKRRKMNGVISRYLFDEAAYAKCKTLKFDTYSEDWLDFVLNCRVGKDSTDYDIIIGGVANDRVFNTVELYFDNLIDKSEALKRLRYEKPNLQICFRNQNVIDKHLKFDGSESV